MYQNNYKNRLYGRTRGRSKKKININFYNEMLNEYIFKKFTPNNKYILDIGTGYGETTIYLSEKNKNKIIVACEKYIDGNLNLLKEIKLREIKNIEIHPGNINDILDKNYTKNYCRKSL